MSLCSFQISHHRDQQLLAKGRIFGGQPGEAGASKSPYCRLFDRVSGEPVLGSRFQAEDVIGQMKGVDLPATIHSSENDRVGGILRTSDRGDCVHHFLPLRRLSIAPRGSVSRRDGGHHLGLALRGYT